MREKLVIVLLIAIVAALPVALRQPGEAPPAHPDDVLVIVTPHTQAVREEWTRAFHDYWKRTTGREVAFDWRLPGGTSDITRLLNAQFANAFQNHWVNTLGRPWSGEVEQGFANAQAAPGSEAAAARAAFLASNVTTGMDIFFGGGGFDFAQQAARGQLVANGVEERHPEWFTPEIFPEVFAGEVLRDTQGRWQGAALSSFGLIYNRDRLKAAGFTEEPTGWADLADPRFAGAVALADPVQSGSNAKAFEMIIQQQMQLRQRALLAEGVPTDEAQKRAVAEGWLAGMRIIQLASANSAYYTDAAPKPVLDVAAGNCVMGMAIDFYGLIEEETLAQRNPHAAARAARFVYLMPHGGSSLSPDPIALLRGAPHPEVAKAFIDFVLSLDGQKLWDFRPGTPGGPVRDALRRAPIRRDLYTGQWRRFMADPDMRPYDEAGEFVYQPTWTSPVFNQMRFVIKAAFIDPHTELAAAWAAIGHARAQGRTAAASAALEHLQDLSAIDYTSADGRIKQAMNAGTLSRFELETMLNGQFRERYDAARKLAEGN